MGGMNRRYEALLKEYLELFPCVGIIGARQSGKTTLLGTLPEEWKRVDLERVSDMESLSRDPDLFLRLNPAKVAIDEAQMLPEVFPALRVAIDADRQTPGRFVITGSSSPRLLKSISESLAGRIAVIEMSTLLWAEIHAPEEGATPSALTIAANREARAADVLDSAGPRGTLQQAHDYWFRGGYPEPWIKATERFRRPWMEQYINAYIYRDVARLFPGLNLPKFRQFMGMLAGLSGSVLNYSDVARTLAISQPTVRDYFDIADGTFLWRRIPPYERNVMKRIVKHPKGYMRDTGLLHYLQRIPDLNALLAHPQMGNSWEGMVIEEIIRQLRSSGCGFDYYHFRTAAGAEVDLVLEGDFGLLPVEIKYTQKVDGRSLRGLRDFVAEHGCRMGLVINNDEAPRLYEKNIVGVPFNWL
jgi:uncharacterized protein